MPEETPAHRVTRELPQPVKTSFTGEAADIVHPEHDPHLAPHEPAAPAAVPPGHPDYIETPALPAWRGRKKADAKE